MKLFKMVFVLSLFCFSLNSLFGMHEPVRTEGPTEREIEKAKIDSKETEIKNKKAEIEALEAKKEKTTEDIQKEYEKNIELNQLLREQIKAEIDFGNQFIDEKINAEKKQKELEVEKNNIVEKIKALNSELAKQGTSTIPEPIVLNISDNLTSAIENSKTTSPRWKKQLEAVFNEFKAKVNELPVIGDPKKALAARDKLATIYSELGDVVNEAKNLIEAGKLDRTINELVGSKAELRRAFKAFDIYAVVLERINGEIIAAGNDPAAKKIAVDKKLRAQQQALQEIVLNSALRFNSTVEFLRYPDFVDALKSENLKKQIEKMEGDIGTLIYNVTEQPNPERFLRTKAEKDLIEQQQKLNVDAFFTNEVRPFDQMVESLKNKIIKQNFRGIPLDKEYSAIKKYLDSFEGLDIQMLSNKELLNVSDLMIKTYRKLIDSIDQRVAQINKSKSDPSELIVIDEQLRVLRENLERWENRGAQARGELFTPKQRDLIRNTIEKIQGNNRDAKTNAQDKNALLPKQVDNAYSLVKEVVDRIDQDEKFAQSSDKLNKQTKEILETLDTSDPSQDALLLIDGLLDSYNELLKNLNELAKTQGPTLSAKKRDFLADAMIKAQNKRQELTWFKNTYQDLLTVIINDTLVSLGQVKKENVRALRENEKIPTDAIQAEQYINLRNSNKKKPAPLLYDQNTRTRWQDILLGKVESTSGGSQASDDGTGGYDG